MPVQFQDVTVQLEGLGQKTDERFAKPGTLVRCDNVNMTESGTLSRRTGYRLVYNLVDIEGVAVRGTTSSVSTQFHHVATFRDELVVFGHDEVFSVASRTNLVDTGTPFAGLVRRGRSPRMSVRLQHVVTSDVTHG